MLNQLSPTFLAFVLAWLMGLYKSNISILSFSILLFTVCLQLLLLTHTRVRNRLLPMRKLNPSSDFRWDAISERTMALLVSPAPAIAQISLLMSAFNLLFAVVYVLPIATILLRDLVGKSGSVVALKEEFIKSQFRVVVHVAGPAESAYQINQWLPVLEKFANKPAIILRNSHIAADMPDTELEIYFAETPLEVEWYLKHGPCTVLYPANSVQNLHVLRHFKLSHLFINHGESDKEVNQSKLLMAYDQILVAGPLAEKRLFDAGLPIRQGQVVHVGRPQAEMFLKPSTSATSDIKRILYAPTWEGFVEDANYSSLNSLGINLLKALSEAKQYEVWFKPHPFSGIRSSLVHKSLRNMNDICERAEFKVLKDSDSLYEAMNWSNLLIADVSSVLNDYLITQKPMILCNSRGQLPENLSLECPTARSAYIFNDSDNLLSLLENIKINDSLRTERSTVKSLSLGNFDEPSLKRFIRVIEELSDTSNEAES